MTINLVPALAIIVLISSHTPSEAATLQIGYVKKDSDDYYAEQRTYTGLKLRDRQRPLAGAKMAIRDSKIPGRAAGIQFEMVEISLTDSEDPAEAIRRHLREQDVKFFLLDLPHTDMNTLATLAPSSEYLMLNVRDRRDGLRCAPALFHTIPTDAMVMDALTQYLSKKHWRKVLILAGEQPADQVLVDAFLRSSKKFRLDIVDQRPFVLRKDPRQRDENNIALLSAGKRHDVIFLADSLGEFGRYVPFSTQQPRPVVGSEGLVSSAWHWTWERHGAPQLNQRFRKLAKRDMQSLDFAAWAAVKAIVEAAVRTKQTTPDSIRSYLLSERFTLDTYKGAPSSFRTWSLQLRQSMLLHTHNAVIARAPIDGFLHQYNNLDTLGVDKPESKCD